VISSNEFKRKVNKSPQATLDIGSSSAVAVHATSRPWLGFLRQAAYTMKSFGLLLLFGLVALSCVVGLWSASRPPHCVAISIVGHTNNAAGIPVVVFQITNSSSSPLAISYGIQIVKSGPLKWYPSQSEMREFRFGQPLLGDTSSNFEFQTPSEGPPWRVYVISAWPPGTFKARIDLLLTKLRLNKRTITISPEIKK
jgi:hypothetical protein